jgi:hypothetical protein
MTSQINYSAINQSYPVAGQDNNSQGFRDNFSAISAGLAQAAVEITTLQTNGIDVTQSSNNLQGTILTNGLFSQFNGVFYSVPHVTADGAIISLDNGPIQQFILTHNATLTFQDWPAAGLYGAIRVLLYGDQSSSYTATLSTVNSGSFRLESTWTGGTSSAPTVAINNAGKYQVIEAWTIDGGAHVFLRSLGRY